MRFFCVSCKGHQAQKDTKKQKRGSCWREKESKEGAWGEVEMVSVIVALQLCCCTELLWRHTDCLVMECSLWWWIKYGCSLYLCWTKDLVCASTITSRCCTLLDYRWEEERATDGSKWRFLEHKGPVMAAPYEPLPSKVRFFYDGKISSSAAISMTLGPFMSGLCWVEVEGLVGWTSLLKSLCREADEAQPTGWGGGHLLCQNAGPWVHYQGCLPEKLLQRLEKGSECLRLYTWSLQLHVLDFFRIFRNCDLEQYTRAHDLSTFVPSPTGNDLGGEV